MDVTTSHLQSSVSQDLLEAERIAAIVEQKVRRKGVAEKMGMQFGHAGDFAKAADNTFNPPTGQGLTLETEDETCGSVCRVRTERRDVAEEYLLQVAAEGDDALLVPLAFHSK